MNENEQQPAPTITVPLREFLDILWGYRDRVDRRDKAVPNRTISEALATIPPEIAKSYFHIQQEAEGLPIVWQIDEWHRSGQREIETKAASNQFNYQADKLTEWLVTTIPAFGRQEVGFVRALVFVIVRDGSYETLIPFGLTPEQIEAIKSGSY